jgi:hypothetical protein
MLAITDRQPFPAGFEIKDIATNGTTLSVRSADRDLLSSCFTGMERQAICGRRSQQSLPATIPLLPLIFAGWGSLPALPEVTTRRHRSGYRRPARRTRDRARGPRDARHRQHGGIRLRCAVS